MVQLLSGWLVARPPLSEISRVLALALMVEAFWVVWAARRPVFGLLSNMPTSPGAAHEKY